MTTIRITIDRICKILMFIINKNKLLPYLRGSRMCRGTLYTAPVVVASSKFLLVIPFSVRVSLSAATWP